MSENGLHRIEDDLADGALDAWIETIMAELEAYLAARASSESS